MAEGRNGYDVEVRGGLFTCKQEELTLPAVRQARSRLKAGHPLGGSGQTLARNYILLISAIPRSSLHSLPFD
jgi:hypothetical protein